MDSTKSIHVDNLEEAHEEMYPLGWIDGLPVIPPTAKLVNAALDFLRETSRSDWRGPADEPHSHRGKGRGELGHGRLPA